MTRIIVRAVPERAAFVEYLQRHLPDAEICHDQTRNAMDTFLRALDMAGGERCIHMEDDALLTQGFRDKAEAVIGQWPDRVIQFFSMRPADLAAGARWDNSFLMGQCFYLPSGYSFAIRNFHKRWKRAAQHPTGLDLMVSDYLKERKERYLIHVPSLVDHRVTKSVIDPRRSSKRQSKTFTEPAA